MVNYQEVLLFLGGKLAPDTDMEYKTTGSASRFQVLWRLPGPGGSPRPLAIEVELERDAMTLRLPSALCNPDDLRDWLDELEWRLEQSRARNVRTRIEPDGDERVVRIEL